MTEPSRQLWDEFRAEVNALHKLDPERLEHYLRGATLGLRMLVRGLKAMRRKAA